MRFGGWLPLGLYAAGMLAAASCAPMQTATGPALPRATLSAPIPEPTYKVGTPYAINGVRYEPKEDPNYNQTGIASWYGHPFHGQRTANGDVYDMNAMTAAHQTLPMPSYVRVTNLENGRSVIVMVNDRGPFVTGRIIDLSHRAAQLLGFSEKGTALTRVEAVPGPTENMIATRGAVADAPVVQVAAAPRPTVAVEALPPVQGIPVAQPVANATPKYLTPVPPEVTVRTVPVTNRIFIQAGAFSSYDGANTVRANLSALGPVAISTVDSGGRQLYRVRLGPLETPARAEATLSMMIARGHTDARIIVE